MKELPKDIFFQTEDADVHWEVPPRSGTLAKLRDNGSCYKYSIETGCKRHDALQLDLFVSEIDHQGNLVEEYSHTNWFLLRFMYAPNFTKSGDIFPLTQVNFKLRDFLSRLRVNGRAFCSLSMEITWPFQRMNHSSMSLQIRYTVVATK